MTLGIHIAFALTSVLCSTYVAFVPSQKKLKISYVFMLGTFTSGIFLSLERGANIAQVCISGLVYTGFVLVSVFLAKRRISRIS